MKDLYMTLINFSFCLSILLLSGCKKFVQIDSPPTLLVRAGVFSDNTTATSAQTVIYSQMSANGESSTMSLYSGLLGDELISYYSPTNIESQIYKNSMTPFMAIGLWPHSYNYIYQANAILEGLATSNGISQSVSQQLSGESKFIRAFWHFYLTICYGDVPLVTTTDYASNALLFRTPQKEVFQQIINDLNDAKNLLSSNYIDFSDTTVTTERTRPTRWAAKALLARTYLYAGKYDSAELEATSVINYTTLFGMEQDLNSVFLANSHEAIWQIQIPQPSIYATQDGLIFILRAEPNGTGNGVSVGSQLLASFESGDGRRANWIHDSTFGGNLYSYPYKYKLVYADPNITEYVMVLRLAEQYLIRAECRAKTGNLEGAISDLDTIRMRAGLSSYKGATDQESLLEAILHERRVELFTEWGHRWFDLIRTEHINSVMSVVAPMKESAWSADGHQKLYPIPQSERNKDPNLTQNPQY
ncbi:RagB/SusD family nutrient uptake outer membrane protein [Flavitalea flava]